jgi:hypothetical protein
MESKMKEGKPLRVQPRFQLPPKCPPPQFSILHLPSSISITSTFPSSLFHLPFPSARYRAERKNPRCFSLISIPTRSITFIMSSHTCRFTDIAAFRSKYDG